METKQKRIYLVFTFCLLSSSVIAQKIESKWAFKGNMGVFGDFYSMHSDTQGAVAARRPWAMGRFVTNSALSYGQLSIPVTINITAGQSSVVLPQLPKGNLIDYIRNPNNQIGIAPKYKWIQLLLGTQVPQYSELSVGDLPVFGAGINLTPGKFRFGFFGGTSQLAIEEDTTKYIQGIFARKIYSVKAGYGTEEASHIYLITSKMEDDTNSLSVMPVNTMPQKGVLSSIDYKIKIGKQYAVSGEIAGSAFTRNTHSKLTKPSEFIPNGIFKTQEASRFDYASALSISRTGKIMSIKISGKYIGDGFVPLGYPFMQTDRLEVMLSPVFNLFKDRVQLMGSIGRRINNLSGARAATNTQTIASANINYQCTEQLSLQAAFSNFDFRNSITSDTLKVEMVTRSWSLGPTYSFTTPLNTHIFTGMYAMSVFKDFNTISGAINDNDSRSTVVSYMLAKVKTPLSISTMFSNFINNTSIGTLVTNSLSLSIGYKFLSNKLKATAGPTFTKNTLAGSDAGAQLMTSLGLKYSLKKKVDFAVNGSVNMFKYGVEKPGISYRENLLRTSIMYKF